MDHREHKPGGRQPAKFENVKQQTTLMQFGRALLVDNECDNTYKRSVLTQQAEFFCLREAPPSPTRRRRIVVFSRDPA